MAWRLQCSCLIFVAAVTTLGTQETPEPDPAQLEAPQILGDGWRWEIPPKRVDPERLFRHGFMTCNDMRRAAFTCAFLCVTKSGETVGLYVTVRHGASIPRYDPYCFLPVLITAEKQVVCPPRLFRFEVFAALKGSPREKGPHREWRRIGKFRFLFPRPLPWERIRWFAVAVPDEEGMVARAEWAWEASRSAGVRLLPPPKVGEEFAFVLPTLDGKTFQARNHRGRVILVHLWSAHDAGRPSELVQLCSRLQNQGLVVVGVNFDEEASGARKSAKEYGFSWPQVHAHTAAGGRMDLWYAAYGVPYVDRKRLIPEQRSRPDNPKEMVRWRMSLSLTTPTLSLPRFLLVDREGVLRADLAGGRKEALEELGQKLRDLLKTNG